MGKKRGRRVRVFLDEVSLMVPAHVDCAWAARGALGLPRGLEVSFVGSDRRLHFQGGHTFKAGDRYQTWRKDPLPEQPAAAEAAGPTDDEDVDEDGRDPWERDPDFWKKS